MLTMSIRCLKHFHRSKVKQKQRQLNLNELTENQVLLAHGHKTLEYNVHTHTPKSSNQNAVFIEYGDMIGCLSRRRSLKFVLESFITVRPDFGTLGFSRFCSVEH